MVPERVLVSVVLSSLGNASSKILLHTLGLLLRTLSTVKRTRLQADSSPDKSHASDFPHLKQLLPTTWTSLIAKSSNPDVLGTLNPKP